MSALSRVWSESSLAWRRWERTSGHSREDRRRGTHGFKVDDEKGSLGQRTIGAKECQYFRSLNGQDSRLLGLRLTGDPRLSSRVELEAGGAGRRIVSSRGDASTERFDHLCWRVMYACLRPVPMDRDARSACRVRLVHRRIPRGLPTLVPCILRDPGWSIALKKSPSEPRTRARRVSGAVSPSSGFSGWWVSAAAGESRRNPPRGARQHGSPAIAALVSSHSYRPAWLTWWTCRTCRDQRLPITAAPLSRTSTSSPSPLSAGVLFDLFHCYDSISNYQRQSRSRLYRAVLAHRNPDRNAASENVPMDAGFKSEEHASLIRR